MPTALTYEVRSTVEPQVERPHPHAETHYTILGLSLNFKRFNSPSAARATGTSGRVGPRTPVHHGRQLSKLMGRWVIETKLLLTRRYKGGGHCY